ncbi:MFS transporter, partial [Pseudomonas aeruginosa]|nr:MFS transporter [Pseudomonas aeruginosa]
PQLAQLAFRRLGSVVALFNNLIPLYVLQLHGGPAQIYVSAVFYFFFHAEDGIRDPEMSRGLGDVYKRQAWLWRTELRQERRQAWPLLPPSLLRLPSIRFGLLLAILFFACWSGFMFALALALQAGAGLSPVQAGNAFIALGASYFVSALLTARVAARIGPVRLLLLGCVIQMCGLLGLMLTLQRVWPQPGILNLAPATLVIGFGQAFIVSSFFRIGLSEVPTAQAGAGSAMLATVQQASLGLGSALLGAVFAHRLERHGDYLEATQTTLAVEFVLMTLLLGATCLFYLRRVRTVPLRCDSPGN